MASISIEKVCLDYPVYGQEPRLFTKKMLSLASAGRLVRSSKVSYVRSVEDLTLSVTSGQRVGLIGNNGAGKTSILKLVSGIYAPSSGVINVDGAINPILGSGYGLDEEATGYENIILGGVTLGRTVKEMKELTKQIAEFTELGSFLDMPFKTYSAGMKTRLAFGITTSFSADILVVDEGIGAGDKDFNAKAQKRLSEFMNNAKILLLASHSNDLIKQFCTHVLVMKGGKNVFFGSVEDGFNYYENEY